MLKGEQKENDLIAYAGLFDRKKKSCDGITDIEFNEEINREMLTKKIN